MHGRNLVLLILLSVALLGQTQSTDVGQPLFSSSCGGCHGLDGRGGEHAPDIVTSSNVRQLSQDGLAGIVRNGIPSAGMPAFGSLFSNQQINAVAKYLRSLQGQGGIGPSEGDAEQGRALFFGKAKCSGCHVMNGKGGFLASDLSGYGSSHSAVDIRRAIVDPNQNLDPRERAVTVVGRNGKSYSGVLRNEDNFSLQMQTADGSFHLFDKSELARIDRLPRSIMPSGYGSELSKTELDNLVAYLAKATASPGNRPHEDDEE
jgi:cytochrome c oxidase cbb3-type subunit III